MYTKAQHIYVCGANVFYQVLFLPLDSPSVSLLSGTFQRHIYCIFVRTVCIHTYSHVHTQAVFFFRRISSLQSQKLSGRELWEATPSGLTWGLNPVNLTLRPVPCVLP